MKVEYVLLAVALMLVPCLFCPADASSTWSVSFDSETDHLDVSVTDGNVIELPCDFEKDGYYLSGWSDGTDTYAPGYDYTVSGNVCFSAIWTEDSSYKVDAETEGTVGTLYTFSPFDGDYSGWETFTTSPNLFKMSTVTTEITIYSKPDWMSIDASTLTFSGRPALPGVYVVDVLIHSSSSSSAHASFYANERVSWTVTVFSETDSRYTLYYDVGKGTSMGFTSASARGGCAIVLPNQGASSYTGHTLAGWKIDVDGTDAIFGLGCPYTIHEDTIATAYWVDSKYALIFNELNADGVRATAVSVGDKVTLPSSATTTKAGYSWYGWTVDGIVYAPGYEYTVKGTLSMTGYWIADSDSKITVSYNANGGSGTLSSQKVKSGDSIALPSSGFYKEGYVLSGWSDGSTTYECGKIVSITSGKTFKAVWEVDQSAEFTVTFSGNGSIRSYSDQTVRYGQTVAEPVDPTRADGYAFVGWYQVGGAEWDFDSPVTHDLALQAHWKKVFTVEVDGDTAKIVLDSSYSGYTYEVDWGDDSSGLTHKYTDAGTHTVSVKVYTNQSHTQYDTASYSFSTSASSSSSGQASGGSSEGTESGSQDKAEGNVNDLWTIIAGVGAVLIIIFVGRMII